MSIFLNVLNIYYFFVFKKKPKVGFIYYWLYLQFIILNFPNTISLPL